MCDQAVRDMLDQTVSELVDNNQAFTAYDVTVKTREREGIELLHRKVRDDVHNIIGDVLDRDREDYDEDDDVNYYITSQLRAPDGGPVTLYHRADYDVSQYQFRSTSSSQPKPIPQPTPAQLAAVFGSSPTPVPPAVAPWVTPSDGVYDIDYRNRLMVPTQFFRELGVKADDTVFILADAMANTLRISSDSQPNSVAYVVERNGDIRISGKTLTAAGLFDSKYRIKTRDDNGSRIIEITKA